MAKFNALYSEIYKQKKHSLSDYTNNYIFITHRLQFARNADIFPLNSTQSLNNESEQCPGVQMEMNNAEDKIFFSTIFKESAIIKIKIKSTEITQNIPAGLYHFSTDFSAGLPEIKVYQKSNNNLILKKLLQLRKY